MKILASITNNIILNNLYATIENLEYWDYNTQGLYNTALSYKPDLLIIDGSLLSITNLEVINELNIKTIVVGMSGSFPQKILSIFIENYVNSKILTNIDYPYYILKSATTNSKLTNIDTNLDISIIYDNPNIDIQQLIIELRNKNYKFAIFGPIKLPIPEYLGIPDMDNIAGIFDGSSMTILFDTCLIYEAALRGCCAVVTTPNDVYPFMKPELLMDFIEKPYTYNKQELISKALNNTYQHRWNDILCQLNLSGC